MAIDEEVTLRKLEVFLAFMRHGSMAAVADAMGLSTVSVHRALHSLQEGLRCPLFKRDGRALIPLATAYTFAEYAQRTLDTCEEGIRRTRQVAGFEATRIRIGSAYSLTVRTIPQLIFGLKSRRPNLDVDMKLGSTRELVEKLRSDELDAALVVTTEEEPAEEFVSLVLFHDPLCFAAPLQSRFSQRELIDLRELKGEKFVALHADFLTAQAMEPLFAAAGFQPEIVMRAGNLFSLANLVAEGIGFGLLPARVGLFTTKVQLIPLAPPFAHQQTIRLLVPRARERDPNLLALIAECRGLPEVVHGQRPPGSR
ncbi:MAG TPA: LysR family transcriptional regulator [Ramlibacter sp.]|uniref:LysR family transcriptional regulator n=1 Tax=Ramlibacter sp. TaxID=1917967 RepID=UPI002ED0F3BB